MTDRSVVLSRPPGLRADIFHTWFDCIADQMLNRSASSSELRPIAAPKSILLPQP